jgi:hypothetical protein
MIIRKKGRRILAILVIGYRNILAGTIVRPPMIATNMEFLIALLKGANDRPAVATGVKEASNFSSPVLCNQDGVTPDVRRHEVIRLA